MEVIFSKVGGRQSETFFNIVLFHRYLLHFVMRVMVPNHEKHRVQFVILLYNLIGKAIPTCIFLLKRVFHLPVKVFLIREIFLLKKNRISANEQVK